MFDHIGLRVRDLEKSSRLYREMLAPLGFIAGSSGDGYAGFGPEGRPALWLHQDMMGGGAHIALRAATREQVDRFFEAGRKAGARENGKPGLRTDYAPNYYGAFLIDLDGNNVEAVCITS